MAAALLAAAISCGKTTQPVPETAMPSGLEVSGDGTEIAMVQDMTPVAEGVWDLYGTFRSGQVKVAETGGKEFVSFRVTPLKEGLCRLRVKADKTWSLVHINKVSLVVTEGDGEAPKTGNKAPVEAVYQGGGVWTVPKLYIGTDHVRYRFLLETDTPAELRYWCATWDNAGAQPAAYSPDYLRIRALGQEEYDALYLKDNRACWMFPLEETGRLADFTLSMNTGTLEVAFSTAHTGPKAAFIGDSITWQWGTSPREIAKSLIVIPLSPLPSFLQDKGTNVLVTWHPSFFSSHGYIDKGISAENTIQMVARYQRDILSADPSVVVIMGGTNDLAQGYSKEQILKNLATMAEGADALGMKVILCSVTPCNEVYSRLSNPNTKGAHILALNKMLKEYALGKGFGWCDYHPALAAPDGLALRDEFCLYDRLHPNPAAYTVMEGIIRPIIDSLTE